MRKKNSLILVICLLLMTCVFTGCGSQDDEGQSAGQQQVSENAADSENNTAAEDGDILEDIFTKSKAIESMSFDWVMTESNGTVSEGTQYIQGKNLRMDMSSPEAGNVIMIFNGDKNEVWMINLDQNMAVRMGDFDIEEESVNPLEALEEYEEDLYYIVGNEEFDGKECAVLEVTIDEGYTKMWVWEKYGFPLKMESNIGGNLIVWEYKNISFDKIEDSIFEVPSGVEIMEM